MDSGGSSLTTHYDTDYPAYYTGVYYGSSTTYADNTAWVDATYRLPGFNQYTTPWYDLAEGQLVP